VQREATQDQRDYLQALASKLAGLISSGDPLASRIAREANLSLMDYDYAARLIEAAEDAVRALEGGNVLVGPWGDQYA
jgi:hypothetical protein